jgi:hypothetical protein
MILCAIRCHAQTHSKFHALEHNTPALATSWAYVAAEFASLGWPVFVGAAFQPGNIYWSRTRPSNQAGGGVILTSSRSWIKFLTRKSLKSRCVYFAPHEDNRIELFEYCQIQKVEKQFLWYTWRYVNSSNKLLAIQSELSTYAMWQFLVLHNVRLHRVAAVVAKISFSWWWVYVGQHVYFSSVLPNQRSQTSPHFYPYVPPFAISIFSVQSQGVWLFCLAVPYRTSLFSLSLSHLKVLAIKKIVHKVMFPMPSTQRVICLTVMRVVVMLSVAKCESLPKHTRVSYM